MCQFFVFNLNLYSEVLCLVDFPNVNSSLHECGYERKAPTPKTLLTYYFGEEDFVVLTSPFLSMLVTVNDFCFWREKTPYDVLLDFSENLCIPGIPSPCKDGQTFCCMFLRMLEFLISFRLLTMFVFVTWVCLRSWFLIPISLIFVYVLVLKVPAFSFNSGTNNWYLLSSYLCVSPANWLID